MEENVAALDIRAINEKLKEKVLLSTYLLWK